MVVGEEGNGVAGCDNVVDAYEEGGRCGTVGGAGC